MKIAITGSEGMIGKELTKNLERKNHKIIKCTKQECNILDIEKLRKKFKGCKIIIHLAAQLDEKAKDLWEVNVKGTENCLEAAATNGIEQFIYISSVGVFGLQKGLKDESTEPKPETLYEKSKLEAEKKVLSYQEVFHITILRPAIVVGNNKYWNQIIKLIKKGFPIIGNGKNHWQTISTEDVANAIEFCIGNENTYGETFIIAEKKPKTLEEIVKIIRNELEIKGKIIKIPEWLGKILAKINTIIKFNNILNIEYIKRLQADRHYSISKIEKIGWKPKNNFEETIKKVIEQMKKDNQL